MDIKENCGEFKSVSAGRYEILYRSGRVEVSEEYVLSEHIINIYVNGIITMKLICTPENLTELVLGRLLTERIIAGTDDVKSINIGENGERADVILNRKTGMGESDYVEITPTSCTGNHIFNDRFADFKREKPGRPVGWKSEWIFNMADLFKEGMPLHDKTRAAHSCFLFMRGNLLFKCEDIGRHNAIDKAIGYGLRNGTDLAECMVYTSGRVPTDMVMKAVCAGIAALVSKAEPTVQAVRLAQEYGLTLIGSARSDRFKVYASGDPESIKCAADESEVVGGRIDS